MQGIASYSQVAIHKFSNENKVEINHFYSYIHSCKALLSNQAKFAKELGQLLGLDGLSSP